MPQRTIFAHCTKGGCEVKCRMSRKSGFSLIELAVVLVVIGLVIGGTMQGMVLIKQSELNRVGTDLSDIQHAVQLFQDKYGYLPGDMPNATQFWGRADGGADVTQNCANPDTDINPNDPMATCNGNGDNQLAIGTDNVNRNTEAYRLWQHLSNAGMFPGKYTGIGGAIGGTNWRIARPGDVPSSPLRDGAYWMEHSQLSAWCGANGWTAFTDTRSKLYTGIGRFTTGGWPWDRILSPEESRIIDTKMDDGRPGLGNMVVTCAADCADSQDADTANYLTTEEADKCNVKFALE